MHTLCLLVAYCSLETCWLPVSGVYMMQVGFCKSSVRYVLQTFHSRYEKFDRFNFEASCGFHYSICMKRLCMHAWYLTCARQLALYKCHFRYAKFLGESYKLALAWVC
jgi:hypothetical protein